MADPTIKDSGPNWTVADLKNGQLVGGVYYSHDRGHMPGGTIDASYCVRISEDQCINFGAGVFGTKGDGPYEPVNYYSSYENTLVPNLHGGTTWLINPTVNLAFLGRVGVASMRGKAYDFNGELAHAYKQPGLYLAGAARLIGNMGVHQLLGSAVFVEGGVASFPAAGSAKRDAGVMLSTGFIVTFGPRNRAREAVAYE
jgi:hypothetical protein